VTPDVLWKIKLAARVHDPAEKALVLLRDPAGHEGGSIVDIGKAVGFDTRLVTRRDGSRVEKVALDPEIDRIVTMADRWASAADRAQFPKDANERFVAWSQVRFAENGQLVHPLSGERYTVPHIGQDVLAEEIKTASAALFKELVHEDVSGSADHRSTCLAFWRFGPDLGKQLKGIGHLWRLLPADTRTPDHTIWQHLDLTSAFAGAMADNERPTLLTVALGPVQEFISAARSTSDLWAGSHFLSMLAWEAMKEVVEIYGPDAILFPQLRAVPIVDLWLIEQGLKADLFEDTDWNDTATDYNPLFVAALPNKFLAIVPESRATELGQRIAKRVRAWVNAEGHRMLERVLEEIDEKPDGQHCFAQLDAQLKDFPEVHWSTVSWLPVKEAEEALAPFYPRDGRRAGLFGSHSWSILTGPIEPEQEWRFWEPNDGILYPAIHDAAERLLAVAKSVRAFPQTPQHGYRDSLTGEHEWLTLDPRQLAEGSPRQRRDTLWARLAERKPSWVKRGEHLSTFGLIKRLWPERFGDLLQQSRWYSGLKNKPALERYVISTHVMALAPSIERLIEKGDGCSEDLERLMGEFSRRCANLRRPALPRRLMRRELRDKPHWSTATRLPALVERARQDAPDEEEWDHVGTELHRLESALGVPAERYYGLLLLDGDRLGAWLSGENTLTFEQAFHDSVRTGLRAYRDPSLARYLTTERPASPARHLTISAALNGFALDLVRHVVEDECLGKVLYAGGDDVMAMICVRDLLKAMAQLRVTYSGGMPAEQLMPGLDTDLEYKRGFVRWRSRLYQAMGTRATASCGAVVAHHQAPLAAVMRELHSAEQRAKREGGRDAFSLTVVKRSGGTLTLTDKWGEPIALLNDLIGFLQSDGVSRRAVYNTLEWIHDLPDPGKHPELLQSLLGYQLQRQASSETSQIARGLARRLTTLAAARSGTGLSWLGNFLAVGEFLAREARGGVKV
jgi:CRISPR-associated protein Cmr2